ncbi:uncharacterized protein BP01DRAFT_381864 [Aspergillus saccharolyticus JOP 1030-1]|uniref:Uncharacterized protein n=1 Tax=Aspergillus saccharolyticus JOP 1030-1 TaxID=1450539 RepID=A0A318ZFM1_9EURO|nr:hypothetical protein BP01DRAFT_381864 [Aspergillus saccharolyticus JOP 1030-1]PYH46229.1 hypothetical protein BP01DRAFT_381864 [Aspergillus saccharolyticus JOP 1030-1]
MLSFKFILILVFGVLIQSAVTITPTTGVTDRDEQHASEATGDGFTPFVSDHSGGIDSVSDDLTTRTAAVDPLTDLNNKAPCRGVCSVTRQCRCRNKHLDLVKICPCDHIGEHCGCPGRLDSRDGNEADGSAVEEAPAAPAVGESPTTPDADKAETPDEGSASSGGVSPAIPSIVRPQVCKGKCSDEHMCACKKKGMTNPVYCYCDNPGKRCTCGAKRAARDAAEAVDSAVGDEVAATPDAADVDAEGVASSDDVSPANPLVDHRRVCYSTCTASYMCHCRHKQVRVHCGCDDPGKKCTCEVLHATRDEDAKDEDAMADESAATPEAAHVTPSDEVDLSDDVSPVDALSSRRPGKCYGRCSLCTGNCKSKYECQCKGTNVVSRCGCERLGQKCQCKGPWRVRDVDATQDKPAVNEPSATSDVDEPAPNPDDTVDSDALDLSDDVSPVDALSCRRPGKCYGRCSLCTENCKSKYECQCKGTNVVSRCGCERLGQKCECKGPWRVAREVEAPAVEETAITPASANTTDVSSVDFVPRECFTLRCTQDHKCLCRDAKGDHIILCDCKTPGRPCSCPHRRDVDPIEKTPVTEENVPAPDTTGLAVTDVTALDSTTMQCVSQRCMRDHKCLCRDGKGGWKVLCDCKKPGRACSCPSRRAVDTSAPVVEDTTEDHIPAAPDTTSIAEAEEAEDSSPPRSCYGTCNQKRQCRCRGRTCSCKSPGEQCKCYVPFLPPRELDEATVDSASTSPSVDEESTPLENENENENVDGPAPSEPTTEDTDPESESATDFTNVEKSPLVARGEPCWGICDKQKDCYCDHIRSNCKCVKRGRRCFCDKGVPDLPPGMGGGVTY